MCALLIPLSRSKPYDLPEPGKSFHLAGPWSTGRTTIARRKNETALALVLRCETAIRDEQACCPLALRVPPLYFLPHARKCYACAPFAALHRNDFVKPAPPPTPPPLILIERRVPRLPACAPSVSLRARASPHRKSPTLKSRWRRLHHASVGRRRWEQGSSMRPSHIRRGRRQKRFRAPHNARASLRCHSLGTQQVGRCQGASAPRSPLQQRQYPRHPARRSHQLGSMPCTCLRAQSRMQLSLTSTAKADQGSWGSGGPAPRGRLATLRARVYL